MLGNAPWSYGLVRRYYVIFSTVFNQIQVPRYDAADPTTVRGLVRVPIQLGPKDKTLARIFADPGAESRPQAVTLPRLSFELKNMRYDGARKQASTESIVVQEGTEYERLYVPVPYDLDFNLYVYSKTQEDGLKIIEQILPFFSPEFSVRAELIPDVVTLNVPIIFNGAVTIEDDYAGGNLSDRRSVIWTLPFTLKGVLFGPKRESGIIKFIDMPLYVPQANVSVADTTRDNTTAIDRVTIQPGLTANGEPTTNAAASVPFEQVQLEDDWDYAVTIYGTLVPGDGEGGEEA